MMALQEVFLDHNIATHGLVVDGVHYRMYDFSHEELETLFGAEALETTVNEGLFTPTPALPLIHGLVLDSSSTIAY